MDPIFGIWKWVVEMVVNEVSEQDDDFVCFLLQQDDFTPLW